MPNSCTIAPMTVFCNTRLLHYCDSTGLQMWTMPTVTFWRQDVQYELKDLDDLDNGNELLGMQDTFTRTKEHIAPWNADERHD